MQRFGEKLHTLRKHHHVTLKWLAHELGYATHSYLSEIESGHKIPGVEFVLKIARLFGVTTDELLKDELEVGLPQMEMKITDDPAVRE